jgi:hypothetical protein
MQNQVSPHEYPTTLPEPEADRIVTQRIVIRAEPGMTQFYPSRKEMTSTEIPAWLGTSPLRYRLPAPVDTSLKSASKNQTPTWLNVVAQADHPMTYTVKEAQRYNGKLLEASAATTKKQQLTRNRIKSAARKLGIRPTPTKPYWMRLHDNLFYGYSSR